MSGDKREEPAREPVPLDDREDRAEHRAVRRERVQSERASGQPNNLVLCCLLADPQLAEVASKVPSSTTELYERVVAEDVQEARARALAILRRRGVHTIDVPAERLTVATIQRYLELKRRYL